MLLKEVIAKIDLCCPFALQEEWDNSGLQIGDPAANIDRVLLAFDFTEAVLAEAVAKKAELIITHHPFFFQGVKRIDLSTSKGKMIAGLLQQNIAVVACHTSLDKMAYGVSAALGNRLNLQDCAVFLPEDSGLGFGMMGYLRQETSFGDFIEMVKKNLNLDALRFVGDPTAPVKKAVVMGGAGAEFMAEAKHQGADVYVSADFKYHDAQAAQEMGLSIIDAGHFGTEVVVLKPFMQKLAAAMPALAFMSSTQSGDFWSYR
ncbi:MAG TPA: Nif3-like dinuclear metal center hexameric protein [Clostridiales bacterium]|nr:Nif3-like dinuclear metal center hexameric protein [Clostridiales bacterium]